MIHGVAFDLDGTLVDTETLHHDAHLAAAREFGVSLVREDAPRVLEHFIGGPDERVAIEIARLAGGERAATPKEILRRKREIFRSAIFNGTEKVVARDGCRDILDLLVGAGVSMTIGTVSEREIALYLLKQADLLSYFTPDRLVAADDVDNLKPAPDVYLRTARILGVDPQFQLVFEDSVVGVRAARVASSQVVALPSPGMAPSYLEALLSSGAERVFTSWRDHALIRFVARL
jgi:beta-phosphoglucomutase-like phosphatase (HAD superfamily)